MKKTIIIFILLLMTFTAGKVGRVDAQLFEGYSYMDDVYLVSFCGYYLPLVSDDLDIGDHVIYHNLFSARYLY